MFIQCSQHQPHCIIHGLNHSRVDRAILHLTHRKLTIKDKTTIRFALRNSLQPVFFPMIPAGLDGAMHRIEREVGQEGLIFAGLNKLGGFTAKPQWQ